MKFLLCLVVLAIAAQQLSVYYNVVVVGTFLKNAPIANAILGGVAWPVAVVAIGGFLIYKIVKFNPKSINDL